MSETWDLGRAWVENRGYSRGTGTLLLPDGGQLQVSHEDAWLPMANLLTQLVWAEWEHPKEAA